jgi:hypothetical protein
LPPSHSHEFVDQVFSAIEEWLHDTGYDGCLDIFALRAYLRKKFGSGTSKYSRDRDPGC